MAVFDKKSLTISEQADLLAARGLVFSDKKRVEGYLRTIGYYRLSAYFYPFLQEPKTSHIYKPDSTFNKVLDLYRFDRKLRLVIFNEIEKIEVAVKSAFVNIVCDKTQDIFWMTDGSYLRQGLHFDVNLHIQGIEAELEKSKEDFIKHFRTTYPNDPYPPAWMLVQILPLGSITQIYKHLNNQSLRKLVSNEFGLPPDIFESWMRVVTNIRNVCCHHARAWNRTIPFRAIRPKKLVRWHHSYNTDRIFTVICIIKYLIDIISPGNNFKMYLQDLLIRFPSIDISAMGFPLDWEKTVLWK